MTLKPQQLVSNEQRDYPNGNRITHSVPHPLLERLQTGCKQGNLTEVSDVLSQVSVEPVDDLPPAALHSLWNSIESAIENGHTKVLAYLLEHGFLNYKLASQAIDGAFKDGKIDILTTFLDAGWDVNETGPDTTMRPLLRHAVTRQYDDMRAFLLARGASPHIPNNRGLTPLETAVQWSPIEIVQELLEHAEADGDDALIAAAEVGNTAVADLLIAKGSDPNRLEKVLPDPWGRRKRRTPLDAALLARRRSMAEWLIEKGATARNYTGEELMGR